MCLVLNNRLGSLPRNSVARLTDRLDMTIVVDWVVEPQINQTNKTVQGYGEKGAGNKVTKSIILKNIVGYYMSRLTTKPTIGMCAKRRLRSAWTSAKPDQSLICPQEESLSP